MIWYWLEDLSFLSPQAGLDGVQVVAIESVVSGIDILVSSTSNFNIIALDHRKKMKNNAIVANIGHFDNEIDSAGLGAWKA